IIELNKTGVLDTKVRRIDANEEAIQRAAKDQYGTVKLLEDTDGDGRIDKSWVWADRLPPCYGVVAALDGVIAVCSPDIFFLADRDGDGKAEVREKLYGTGGGPMWNRPSNPRWNIDNWIYHDGGHRFKPDGSVIEPITGNGQFGQAVSDWGDRFFMVQVQPVRYVVPLPHRYLARNPYHSARAGWESLLPYNDMYPISQPHPWRLKRSQDPAWVKFYGATETSYGYVTSACGNVIYRATQLPAEYHGNYFFCEEAYNLIHRCLLVRDGASYKVQRATDQKVEFLASTEQWFFPVNLMNGPDGALYIVDMYREIIEDYSAIPRFLQQQYVESLIAGGDRGRIYRIVADGAPKPKKFDLNKASTAKLVSELSNSNAWWRETAQRLLVERGDKTAAVGPLSDLVRNGKTPQARLHALYTLEGLGVLEPAVAEHALGDPHFAVRMHALRVAEPWLDESPTLARKVFAMVDDPDAKVRLQLSLTLGQSKDPRVVPTLAQLAARYGREKWVADAIVSSVPDSADELLGAIARQAGEMGQALQLIQPLAAVVGARHDNDEIGNLLKTIDEGMGEKSGPLKVACLKGLIEGLNRGKPRPLTSSAGQVALAHLLGNPSAELQELAIEVAGLVKLQEGKEMKKALAVAREVALD
ncbi:MAG: PVC-type heme-binding CxxCH protein, partial [Planctomycetota bacterium]